jgi:type 1 glutamine amidotransferase
MTVLSSLAALMVTIALPFSSPVEAAAMNPPKIPVLIIDGMNNHDWPRATRMLKAILTKSGLFAVDVSTTPTADASAAQWDAWHPDFTRYRAVISNYNNMDGAKKGYWPPQVEKAFEDYVRKGGGFVSFHAANNAFTDWKAYNEMIGLGWRSKTFGPSLVITPDEKVQVIPAGEGQGPGHPSEHDFEITVLDPQHPITSGLPKKWLHPHDQLTHGQHGPMKNLTVLTYAYADDVKENEPMDWVVSYGAGRVYVTMQGHLWKDGPDTALRSVGFQTLFVRGVQWAATGKVTYPVPANFPTATQSSLVPEATASTSGGELSP